MEILSLIESKAIEFGSKVDRILRKSLGQFFTPKEIAVYMSTLITLDISKVRILDPGAGNGILSCSLLCEILKSEKVNEIHVDLYESDEGICELLDESFKEINELYKRTNKKLTYNLFKEDFILANINFWNDKSFMGKYDIVIANPPYYKIKKNTIDSIDVMKNIVFGQPNIYFLFMAMSIKLLVNGGQFVFITPRSYLNGLYFRDFRKWLISEVDIEKFTTFESRKKPFVKEKILQETLIIKGTKSTIQKKLIEITQIDEELTVDLSNSIFIEKDLLIDKSENNYIMIPQNKDEYFSLEFVNHWPNTLSSSGYRVSTGKVVDFRNKSNLINGIEITDTEVPLIWNINLKNGEFIWPVINKKKFQLISNRNRYTVPNSNYLLIRRMSSKEENRRLQIAPYFKEVLITSRIAIENHVNYLYKINSEISKTELLGLFIIFNSNIIDNYFRQLSGSTQVNATELNSMKFPSNNDVIELGRIAMESKELSSDICDEILLQYFKKGINKWVIPKNY